MSAVRAFVLSGLAGMMLDLDHLTNPLLNGVHLNTVWSYMIENGSRPLHIPGLWASFMVFIYFWIGDVKDE